MYPCLDEAHECEVRNIPISYADEESLQAALKSVGLDGGAIQKISVHVRRAEENGSWALVTLESADALEAMLAAHVSVAVDNHHGHGQHLHQLAVTRSAVRLHARGKLKSASSD